MVELTPKRHVLQLRHGPIILHQQKVTRLRRLDEFVLTDALVFRKHAHRGSAP